jgi:hypothetical protein
MSFEEKYGVSLPKFDAEIDKTDPDWYKRKIRFNYFIRWGSEKHPLPDLNLVMDRSYSSTVNRFVFALIDLITDHPDYIDKTLDLFKGKTGAGGLFDFVDTMIEEINRAFELGAKRE